MEEKIKKIMATIFEIDPSEIDDNTSPDTIKTWVSLTHMNLVVALEEEFNITFDEEEIVEMLEYKLIYGTIKRKVSV